MVHRYDDQKIFLVDIMKTLNLPLVIVTTAALGSINACVLTVEYARNRGLEVLAKVKDGDTDLGVQPF